MDRAGRTASAPSIAATDWREREVASLTREEYEQVRANGTQFVIALDHENPELDLLVAEHDGYAVVRKLPGFPARLASASDPRRVSGQGGAL